MNEPPIEAVASGVAAGVTAITVAAFGIEPQPIAWVALGASLGIVTTEPTGRGRAIAVFVGTVFAGALAATLAAEHYALSNAWRNMIALGLGAFFPLIKERLAMHVPKMLDRVLKGKRP